MTLVDPVFVAVTVMVSPFVYVPGTSIRGVVSLVMSSIDDAPVSESVARSGTDGLAGRTTSVPLPLEPANEPLDGVRVAPIENEPGTVGV